MSYGNKQKFIQQILVSVAETLKELEAAWRRGFITEEERISEYNEIIDTAAKMIQQI